MRQIDENPEFEESELNIVQRSAETKKFTVRVNESKPKTEEGEL